MFVRYHYYIQMGKLTRAIRQLQSVQLGDPEQSGYCDLKLDVMDMYFASLATQETIFVGGDRRLTHGTSLDVMVKATKLLQRDFEVDGEDDYIRYFTKSKYTYYMILQSAYHVNTVDCAMRIILDDLKSPKCVVIDFVRTRKKMMGQGLATQLVKFLLKGCSTFGSNVFVTSTKEAKSYWKKFGFEIETNEDIDYLLNEFGDCTLMSLPTNGPFELPSDYSGSELTDCSDSSDESSSSDDSSSSSDDSSSDTSESED